MCQFSFEERRAGYSSICVKFSSGSAAAGIAPYASFSIGSATRRVIYVSF
ncbi:MAG TPA: hypothetical protein PLI57_06105 [Spirochaetota bacterium]|nr:hypothetical protein [Spirochaetota bacterium]